MIINVALSLRYSTGGKVIRYQEAAWTISNITAGNHNQIQVVIEAGVLQPLIDILVKVQGVSEKAL